jgi:tetratricopeptide (TPR) repeat protein
MFKTILEISERQFGSDSLETLIATNYLGVIIKQQKQLFEAEIFLRKALDGLDRYYDKGTNTKCLENTHENGDNKSINLVRTDEADFDAKSINGEKYTSVYAEICYNYAVLCVQLGKRKRAGKYFGKAHRGLTISLGAENLHTLDALHWEIKCMCDTQGQGSPIGTVNVTDKISLSLSIPSQSTLLDGDKAAADKVSILIV